MAYARREFPPPVHLVSKANIRMSVFWWANRRVFPSDIEYIIYAIIDVLLHPATCLWLLEVEVPNVGVDYDVDVIQHAAPVFDLSQACLLLRMAQVTMWYYNQGYKS